MRCRVIAPLREPAPAKAAPRSSSHLREARRAVATMLFEKLPQLAESPLPPIRVWKAWFFALWAVLVVAIYFWLAGNWWHVGPY